MTPGSFYPIYSLHYFYAMTEFWMSEMPRFADLASISPPTDLEKNKISFFDDFGSRLAQGGKSYQAIEEQLQNICNSQWKFFEGN